MTSLALESSRHPMHQPEKNVVLPADSNTKCREFEVVSNEDCRMKEVKEHKSHTQKTWRTFWFVAGVEYCGWKEVDLDGGVPWDWDRENMAPARPGSLPQL